MNFFSYKVEHDYGLAPNPFGEYCTLAVCKPKIRKNRKLELGDWIIGTGSKKLKKLNHLIFAMKVEGKIPFDEYWKDERFQYKKPILNGSLVQIFGDNFYHKDEKNPQKWIQEKSAHSVVDCEKHKTKDLGGEYVLYTTTFYYFGNQAPLIPEELHEICNDGRDFKYVEENLGLKFISWLDHGFTEGLNGDPMDWSKIK